MPRRHVHKPSKKNRTQHPSGLPVRLAAALEEIDRAIGDEDWEFAYDILEDQNEAFPRRVEVLDRLTLVAAKAGELVRAEVAAMDLVDLQPDNAEFNLRKITLQCRNGRVFLAKQTAERIDWTSPEHQKNDSVRKLLDYMDQQAELQTRLLAQGGVESLEGMLEIDRASLHLVLGEWRKVRDAAERALKRHPAAAIPRLVMAKAYVEEGQPDRALVLVREVLDSDPEEPNALGQAVRCECLLGHPESAKTYAERLKRAPVRMHGEEISRATAAMYVDDGDGVLAVYRSAEIDPKTQRPRDANLLHLAAVVHARRGDIDAAAELWEAAILADPHLDIAHDNLDDLDSSEGNRNGPWALPYSAWVPDDVDEEFETLMDGLVDETFSRTKARIEKFGRKHPDLIARIPQMLAYGDRMARDCALDLVHAASTDDIRDALREFVLGPSGEDDLRADAAEIAVQNGVLDPGRYEVWRVGERKVVTLVNFEVTDQPRYRHDSNVRKLLLAANRATEIDDYPSAREALGAARDLAPGRPDIELAVLTADRQLGVERDYEADLRALMAADPNFLMPAIALSAYLFTNKRFDEARDLLEPVERARVMTADEASEFYSVEAGLAMAAGDDEAVEYWFASWSVSLPDDPRLAELTQLLEDGLLDDEDDDEEADEDI